MTKISKIYLKIKGVDKYFFRRDNPGINKIIYEEDFKFEEMYVKLSDVLRCFES